jgi:hypothetical protein
MISRMHFMRNGCRKCGGPVALKTWRQAGQIAGHKEEAPKVKSSRQSGGTFWQETTEAERLPVAPDALFTLRLRDRQQSYSPISLARPTAAP